MFIVKPETFQSDRNKTIDNVEESVLVECRHTFFLIHKTKASFLVRKEPTAVSLILPNSGALSSLSSAPFSSPGSSIIYKELPLIYELSLRAIFKYSSKPTSSHKQLKDSQWKEEEICGTNKVTTCPGDPAIPL